MRHDLAPHVDACLGPDRQSATLRRFEAGVGVDMHAVAEFDLAVWSGLIHHGAIAEEDMTAKTQARVMENSAGGNEPGRIEASQGVSCSMRRRTPRRHAHRQAADASVAGAEHPESAPPPLPPRPPGGSRAHDDTPASSAAVGAGSY